MSILTKDECPKCGDTLYWYPAINEQGWRCCRCSHRPGEPPGYNPGLDKASIHSKVNALHDVADTHLISVSNGSHGDGIVTTVANRCIEAGLFDQTTILQFIFESDSSHVTYWRNGGDGVRSGNDPRHRCAGGQLATRSSWHASGVVRMCSDGACPCHVGDDVPF